MKLIRAPRNLIFILAFFVVIMGAKVLYAQGLSQAKVIEFKGDATFMKAGSSVWNKIELTTILEEGDSIKTGPDGAVLIELIGAAKTGEVVIRKGTVFKLGTFRHNEETKVENTLLNVDVGNILITAEKLEGDSKFEVKTPSSIIGIRGTKFEVDVAEA